MAMCARIALFRNCLPGRVTRATDHCARCPGSILSLVKCFFFFLSSITFFCLLSKSTMVLLPLSFLRFNISMKYVRQVKVVFMFLFSHLRVIGIIVTIIIIIPDTNNIDFQHSTQFTEIPS